MSPGKLFLGPLRHWVLLGVMVGVMFILGSRSAHVRQFVPFVLMLLGVVSAAMAYIFLTFRTGEPITRDPIDQTERSPVEADDA